MKMANRDGYNLRVHGVFAPTARRKGQNLGKQIQTLTVAEGYLLI